MKTMMTKAMAAQALDLTHAVGERGPKTMAARMRVATWLDLGGTVTQKLRSDVGWLLHLAGKEG